MQLTMVRGPFIEQRTEQLRGVDALPVSLRRIDEADLESVGRLYAACYPPSVVGDETAAIADVRASWRGEYGEWLHGCSLVAEVDGQLVAAVQRRTTPMMFHPDGNRLLVIASNVGAHNHPDWYLNLVADPHVTVEIGTETYGAVANPLVGAERPRIWAMLKKAYPFFAEHEAATDRTIPVIALTKANPDAPVLSS